MFLNQKLQGTKVTIIFIVFKISNDTEVFMK